MPQLISEDFLNEAIKKRKEGTTPEEFQVWVSGWFKSYQNSQPNPEALNSMLANTVPGYKAPTEEQIRERRELQERARKSLETYVLQTQGYMGIYDYGPGVTPRWLDTLMEPVIHPGDGNHKHNEQKAKAIREHDADGLHKLFYSAFDSMALFNPNRKLAAYDEELETYLDNGLRIYEMSAEAEHIMDDLKKSGLQITQEEEDAFLGLAHGIQDSYHVFAGRIGQILDANYPECDLSQLKANALAGVTLGGLSENIGLQNPSLYNALKSKETEMNGRNANFETYISESLSKSPALKDRPLGRFTVSPSPEPGKHKSTIVSDEDYEYAQEYLKDLAEGKTVYLHEEGEKGRIIPVRDFGGKGVLTVVPQEVKQPGFFTRLADNVATALGGKGFQSCRAYEAYEAQMERVEKAAKAAPQDPYSEFNRAYLSHQSIKAEKRKRDAEKEERSKVPTKIKEIRDAVAKEEEKCDRISTLMDEMLGPDADGGVLLKEKHFTTDVYDPHPMEVPEEFRKDFALIACACTLEEKLLPLVPKRNQPSLNTEQKLDLFYISSVSDVFISMRPVFASLIAHFQPARENALSYLQEYQKGNKEPLAKALGNAFNQSVIACCKEDQYGSEFRPSVQIQRMFYEVLNRDPDLMKLSGVDPANVDRYLSNEVRCMAHQRSMEAQTKLLESLRDGKPLPEEEKAQCLKDVFLDRGMDHFDRMSLAAVRESPHGKEMEEQMMQIATKESRARQELERARKKNAPAEKIAELEKAHDAMVLENDLNNARNHHMCCEKEFSQVRIEIGKMKDPNAGLDFVESYIEKTPAFQSLMEADEASLRNYLTDEHETVSRTAFKQTNDIIEKEKAQELAVKQKALANEKDLNKAEEAKHHAAGPGKAV